MADITDVSNALVSIIAGLIYPNGTGSASAAGVPVKVYAGWPSANSIDDDLRAGITNLTVFPRPEEKNVTRYPKDWVSGPLAAKTFTLTSLGQVITVSGAQPNPFYPHNFAVFVNGVPFTYKALGTDTPALIAAALQAKIVVAVPGTTVTGAAITLPSSARIGALRVGTQATATREVRRQQKRFQITIWSDTPDHRSAVASVFDAALADMPRIDLADGSTARLIYQSGTDQDIFQKEKLYRRDFFYSVEFATMQSMDAPEAIVFETDFYIAAPDGSKIEPPILTIQA